MIKQNFLKRLSNLPLFHTLLSPILLARARNELAFVANHFNRHFYPLVGTSPKIREEACKIRHQVYCEELGFEPSKEDHLERDEFDEMSVFGVVMHKASRTFAGCMRMVFPKSRELGLPMTKHFPNLITDPEFNPDNFPIETITEVSRFAIPKNFRRRKGDLYTSGASAYIQDPSLSIEDLRRFPFISVGLAFLCAAIALESGRNNVFILAEPRLASSVTLMGLPFKQIGPSIEFHGKRAPYGFTCDRESIKKGMPPYLAFLMGSIFTSVEEQWNRLDHYQEVKPS